MKKTNKQLSIIESSYLRCEVKLATCYLLSATCEEEDAKRIAGKFLTMVVQEFNL